MSKKTKKLEKENQTLTRKHDQTNRNILEMAEERTRAHEEIEKWRKKSNSLEALCRRMQEQRRGQAVETDITQEGDDDGTESDYEGEYEEEEERNVSEDGHFGHVGNGAEGVDASHPAFRERIQGQHPPQSHQMHQQSIRDQKAVFGPPPPPPIAASEASANGNRIVNGA